MPYDFYDKVALVTGGSNGIGLAYVKELLKNGVKGVTIVDIFQQRNEFDDEKVLFLKTDVTDDTELEESFKKTIEKFGRLDIVINNAGINAENDFQKIIKINANAVCSGTLLGFKYMDKNNGGSGGIIVNTSSILGVDYFTACPIYTATKHFVLALGVSMGTNFYYDLTGVKIMTICPGLTETKIMRAEDGDRLPFKGMLVQVSNQAMQLTPLQKPQNVGRALIKALNYGENGNVWVANHEEEAYLHKPTGKMHI